MQTYVLLCRDKPDALELRLANRQAHLAYVDERLGSVRLGGPLLDDEGQMRGSMLVLQVRDRAEAEAFAASDPYALAGLFEHTELMAVRFTIGAIA